MATKHDFHKAIIGRSEVITFVGTDAIAVPAKTDTGAYRSAAHASNIVLDQENGILSFDLLGNHPVCGNESVKISTSDFNRVGVVSSSGHREDRYEVKLKVKIGSKVFHAKFTLTDRSARVYPILLGRTLLNGRFVVDSSQTSIDRARLKNHYGIEFPVDEEEGR